MFTLDFENVSVSFSLNFFSILLKKEK
jgi:hypothetical protein